jgi:hypothetical protein
MEESFQIVLVMAIQKVRQDVEIKAHVLNPMQVADHFIPHHPAMI